MLYRIASSLLWLLIMGSSIATLKEQTPVTYAPVILAEFQFVDASTYFVSTKPLNSSEGGFSFAGQNYQARISSQDIPAIQANAESGIDRVPQVTLHIADSDRTLWSNFEQSGIGFKGARLTLRLIFWNADTSTFSSDSYTPFIGICDAPRIEREGRGDVMVITATANRNMQRSFLPSFHIQQLCSNIFPATAAQRLDGASNMASPYWGCGYDPDQAGTDPEIGGDCRRGNLNAGVPFTTCTYTKQSCVARGMYSQDGSARRTGRFTGQQWAPPNRLIFSKSYIEGKTIPVVNGRNDAIYTERVPMVYGTQWVNPVVVNIMGDANFTQHEVIVCQDNIGLDGIIQVVVQGVIIPDFASTDDKNGLNWVYVTDGTRNGFAYGGTPYNSQGDPYGSLATIRIIYYYQLNTGTVPQMQVLLQGPKIKLPNTASISDQATWPMGHTDSPPDILLDVLIWSNWDYRDIDIQSIIDERAYCSASVSYTNFTGGTSSHPRFRCKMAINRQRSAGEIVSAVLRSFNAQLARDPVTGLLKLTIRKTLADQHPSPVTGSNYNTAVSSVTAAGVTTNGYFAYLFDESSVSRSDENDPPFIRVYNEPSGSTPNEVTVSFQDEDNTYSQDSATIVDTDGVGRAGGYQGGQEINEPWNVLGLSNFDQVVRVARTYLAERLRGNPANDTRGTMFFEITTNFRAAHLRKGMICGLSWQSLGIVKQPVRVVSIQIGTDFETSRIVLSWHNDIWYTDTWAQQEPPAYSMGTVQRPNRLPYPPQPIWTAAIVADPVFGSPPNCGTGTWGNFGIQQHYSYLPNGEVLTQLQIFGAALINVLSNPSVTGGTIPPIWGVQATTSSTGGTIPGGITVHLGIVAIDANGLMTPLSKLTSVSIPVGTNTNTVTTPPISWPTNATGYFLYAGVSENNLSFAAAATASTPSTITISKLYFAAGCPPDPVASGLAFRGKIVVHGGVWGDVCKTVVGSVLGFAGAWTTNQWVGYDIIHIAKGNGNSNFVPWATYQVTANDASHLTVTPAPSGIDPGDVFIMMSKLSSATATTMTDPNWVNSYGPSGLTPHAEQGHVIRIIAGTGFRQTRTIADNTATTITVSKPWVTIPDATTRYIIEEKTWRYDFGTVPIESAFVGFDPANPYVISSSPIAKLEIKNYDGQTVLIEANAIDAKKELSLEPFAPLRMIYVWGQTLGYFPLVIAANAVTPDLNNGYRHEVTLNQAAQVTINNPVFTGGNFRPGLPVLTIIIVQDGTGGRPAPAWDTAYVGLTDADKQIGPDPNTYNIYEFKLRADLNWALHGNPVIGRSV